MATATTTKTKTKATKKTTAKKTTKKTTKKRATPKKNLDLRFREKNRQGADRT